MKPYSPSPKSEITKGRQNLWRKFVQKSATDIAESLGLGQGLAVAQPPNNGLRRFSRIAGQFSPAPSRSITNLDIPCYLCHNTLSNPSENRHERLTHARTRKARGEQSPKRPLPVRQRSHPRGAAAPRSPGIASARLNSKKCPGKFKSVSTSLTAGRGLMATRS